MPQTQKRKFAVNLGELISFLSILEVYSHERGRPVHTSAKAKWPSVLVGFANLN